MARVYVTEYRELLDTEHAIPVEPALAAQLLDFTSSEALGEALNEQTKIVQMTAVEGHHYQFGTSPTADANSPRMKAGEIKYVAIDPNTGLTIAFWDGSS